MKALSHWFGSCSPSGVLLIVLAGVASEVSARADLNEAKQRNLGSVEIAFGTWRSELPPGLSLVVPGGGLVNNGFPAISADRERIAVFYYARHPLEGGYPTLDIYSTASLRLQKRIDFFPEHQHMIEEKRQDPDLTDPVLLSRIERRVIQVDRMLAEDGYRSMETLYDVPA